MRLERVCAACGVRASAAAAKQLTDRSGEFAFGPGREVALKGLSGTHVVHAVEWAV